MIFRYCLAIIFIITTSLCARKENPLHETDRKQDLDSAAVFYKTGLAYQGLLKYDSASAAFGKALKIDTANTDILLSAGNNYGILGLSDEAFKCYYKIISADSLNAGAIRALAKLYFELEVFDSARIYYSKLLIKDSTNSFINRQMGYCFLKQRQLQKSIEYLLKAYYPSGTDLMSLAQLAINYLALKNPSEARKYALIGIEKKPKNALFNKLMGDISYYEKEYQNAAGYFYKAYQLGDQSAHCLQKLGISFYSFADKTDSINVNEKTIYYLQAVEAFKGAANADSTDAITYYFMGQAYKKLYKNTEAVSCYDKVISLTVPLFMCDVYMNRADACSYLMRYEESIADYESALYYKPSRIDILAQQGIIFEMKLGDIETARKYYARYLANFTENTSDASALEIRARLKILNRKK